jgi:hypothetical protein
MMTLYRRSVAALLTFVALTPMRLSALPSQGVMAQVTRYSLPSPLLGDTVVGFRGPAWSIDFKLDGTYVLTGDRVTAIRGALPALLRTLNMDCGAVRGLAVPGVYSVLTIEVSGLDDSLAKPWAVRMDAHGLIDVVGDLPQATRDIWVDIGKEMQHQCWKLPR